MSSNFIVFPFRAVSGLFFLSLERQREKTSRNGAKVRREAGGGWQGASGGAVRDKHALSFGATPAHQPERTPEPRPSGVHPDEAKLENDGRSPHVPGALSLPIGLFMGTQNVASA